MDFIWDNPPDKGTRTGKWSSVALELREHPTKWAKLYEGKDRNAHSLAARLRLNDSFGDEFEIISRTVAPKNINGEIVKQAGVWVKFVGEAPPVAPEAPEDEGDDEMEALVHEIDDAIHNAGDVA